MDKAHTAYITILVDALHQLHEAYPRQQIALRIEEIEPNSWQCLIEFTDRGAKLASESFHINPPEARR